MEHESDELFLERREEALGDSVIPAIPLTAHALLHPIAEEPPTKDLARVLAPAVAVEYEPWRRSSGAHGRIERLADQASSHAFAQAPADDFARVQVNNHAQARVSNRSWPGISGLFGSKSARAYQSSNALAADAHALLRELAVDAWRTVAP